MDIISIEVYFIIKETQMAGNDNRDDRYKLLCEKVLNESWSAIEQHTEDIQIALEKKELDEKDIILIKLAARAFLQKAMMEKAESVALFGVDLYKLSPCGEKSQEDCPCEEEDLCSFRTISS
jgi:hypothetical protein